MFIDRIPNRRSPPAILLRESFRQDGKSRKRTLANLSRLPKHVVDALDALLKGTTQTPSSDTFDIVRTLPHGHAAAVLGSPVASIASSPPAARPNATSWRA